jgi:hypothetical protein
MSLSCLYCLAKNNPYGIPCVGDCPDHPTPLSPLFEHTEDDLIVLPDLDHVPKEKIYFCDCGNIVSEPGTCDACWSQRLHRECKRQKTQS